MPPTRELIQKRLEGQEAVTEEPADDEPSHNEPQQQDEEDEPEDNTNTPEQEKISLVYDDDGNLVDHELEQGSQARRQKRREQRASGEPKHKPDPQRIQELRAKLASRIQELREKRKAPGTSVRGAPLNREAILEARRERERTNREKMLLKRKRDEEEQDQEQEQEQEQEEGSDIEDVPQQPAETVPAKTEPAPPTTKPADAAAAAAAADAKKLKKQQKKLKKKERQDSFTKAHTSRPFPKPSSSGSGGASGASGTQAKVRNKKAVKKRAGFEGRRASSGKSNAHKKAKKN